MKYNIGEKLKHYRKKANLSQKQVAERLNINRSTYTYYERGKTKPSIGQLYKLTHIFNVGYDDLLPNEKEESHHIKTNECFYNLSVNEKSIILAYRLLNSDKKQEIKEIIGV